MSVLKVHWPSQSVTVVAIGEGPSTQPEMVTGVRIQHTSFIFVSKLLVLDVYEQESSADKLGHEPEYM